VAIGSGESGYDSILKLEAGSWKQVAGSMLCSQKFHLSGAGPDKPETRRREPHW
jgi:hypothetical protein